MGNAVVGRQLPASISSRMTATRRHALPGDARRRTRVRAPTSKQATAPTTRSIWYGRSNVGDRTVTWLVVELFVGVAVTWTRAAAFGGRAAGAPAAAGAAERTVVAAAKARGAEVRAASTAWPAPAELAVEAGPRGPLRASERPRASKSTAAADRKLSGSTRAGGGRRIGVVGGNKKERGSSGGGISCSRSAVVSKEFRRARQWAQTVR
jgi:hypothetical protein